MTIEIHEPELEALIQRRMESGRFGSVEEALLEALKSEERDAAAPSMRPAGRKSLAELFADSPFKGLDIEFPRDNTPLRPVNL